MYYLVERITRSRSNDQRLLAALSAGLLLVFTASACGGGSQDSSSRPTSGDAGVCADKNCETGVCDPSTGTCTSPDGGSNVDTDSEDGCQEGSCERGVCDSETGECVNANICSENAECKEGFACDGQECNSEQEICQQLDCQRGVCDFENQECVDAESCEGDQECLEGDYCTDDGTCKENKCLSNMTDCSGGGVCDKSSGECVNKTPCSSSDDCLPMHVCLQQENGPNTCKEEEKARNEACPGDQRSSYDADNLTISCEEPPTCNESLDCIDDRICRNGSCQDPPSSCSDDNFEPNNDTSGQTKFLENAQNGSLSASICPSDTDVFLFNKRNLEESRPRGRLIVDLRYEREDVGLGTLQVELKEAKDDGTFATVETKKAAGSGQGPRAIHLEKKIEIGDPSKYQIRVSGTGDLNQAGIRYDLDADVVSQSLAKSCNQASELDTQSPTTNGQTSGTSSVEFTASCIDEGSAQSSDWLRTFELQTRSYVTIEVQPTGGGNSNLAASLRSTCESAASEVACANANGEGESETIERELPAGTYYLVVQGTSNQKGGPFTITYESQEVVCSSANNTCKNEDTAKICNDTGTGFREVDCQSGCDDQRGVCERPAGDACYTAVDATGGIDKTKKGTIEWTRLQNDIDPGGNCISKPNPETTGPDKIYSVDLKGGEALSATLELGQGQHGALYLLESCGSKTPSSCLAATDSSTTTESLTYTNESSSPETVYVVADTESGKASGQANLDIDAGPTDVCQDGETTCQGDKVAACNSVGTGYNPDYTCPDGCKNGSCTGDTCKAPIDVGTGGTKQLDMQTYNNSYSLSDGNACTDDTIETADAVLSVTADKNDWIDVDVTSSDNDDDPTVFAMDTCTTSNPAQSCVAGADEEYGEQESLRFQAPSQGTYFIVVGGDTSGQADGTYTVEVETSKGCQPGNSSCQNNKRTYCTSKGQQKTVTCARGCKSGACVGDTCNAPIDVGTGGTEKLDMTSFADDYDIPSNNSCTDDPIETADAVLSVTADKGDWLDVDIQSDDSGDDPTVYVLENCVASNHGQACIAGAGNENTGDQESLRFQVPSAGDYLLVIGADNTGQAEGTFTVDVKTPSGCQPGSSSCKSSSKRQYCTKKGFQKTQTCPTSCKNGDCVGDTCSQPIDLGTGGTNTVDMTTFANDYKLSSNNSCTGDEIPTNDAVFKIQAQKGQWIDATVTSNDPDDDPTLYILDTCPSSSDHSSACLAGADDALDEKESLRYQAPSSGTYFIVVGGDGTGAAEGAFTIDAETSKGCSPLNSATCKDKSTATVCSNKGETSEQACALSCKDNQTQSGCLAETCRAPVDLGRGGTETFDISKFSDDYDIDSSNSCTGSGMSSEEVVVQVEANQGEWINVDVESDDGGDDPTFYVLDQCTASGHGNACIAGSDQSSGSTETGRFKAPSDGTYFVVVGGVESYDNDGVFTVDVQTKAPCSNTGTTQCKSGNVRTCTQDGYPKVKNCPDGCRNKTCVGETCQVPIDLGRGGSKQVDLGEAFANDYNLTDSNSCTGDEMSTAEAVFQIQAQQGEWIDIDVSSQRADDDPSFYLLDSCPSPGNHDSQCIGGSDETYTGEVESLNFKVPSSGTYFLVVGGDDPDEGQGVFNVEAQVKASCSNSGQKSCIQSDVLRTCQSNGFPKDRTCDYQCSNQQCVGDTCSAPVQVTGNGGEWTVEVADDQNDYQLSSNSCVGDEMQAPDLVYSVQMDPKETLTASVTPKSQDDNPAVYITDTCGKTSVQEQNCIVGADDEGDGDAEQVQFATPQGKSGTYYVVVDGEDPDEAKGEWTVDIDVESFSCTPGEQRCKASTSSELEYCNTFGQFETYTCSGKCDSSKSRCANPTGDICVDAVPLKAGDSFKGSFDNYDNNFEPTSGTCFFQDAPATDGPDALFSIDLQKGDLLTAKLQTDAFDPALAVLGTCPASGSSCERGMTRTNSLQYRASQAGTYYIVADSSDGSADDAFTLDVSVDSNKTCIPGSTTCNQGSGNLDVCKEDGSGYRSVTYACARGCAGRFCTPPSTANNTCADAYPIQGQGVRIVDSRSRFKDEYDPSGTNGCVEDSEGRDAVYSVTVDAGEYVEATVTPLGDDSDDPRVYFLTDCQNPTSSCLGGASIDNEPITDGYYNDTGSSQNIYLVVDADQDTHEEQFMLDVEVGSAECNPTTQPKPAQCADKNTAEICNDYGLYEPKTCFQGCDSSTGRCKKPTHAKCGQAVQIKRSKQTQTFRGRHQNFSSDYDAQQSGGGSSCVGNSTPGPDAVYQVDLNKGDILKAEYDSTEDAALWVTTDCSTAAQSCVAGSDDGDPESITFQASKSGTNTYYVIADVDDSSSNISGDFQLDVTYAGPPECDPNNYSPSCQGNDLQYCAQPGFYDTYDCPKSCKTRSGADSCANPKGQICADAIPATSGYSVTDKSFGERELYSPGPGSVGQCNFTELSFIGTNIGEPTSQEDIYRVDLASGETLSASFSTDRFSPRYNIGSGVLYLLKTCGDLSTCQANTDFQSTRGLSGSITYTAQSKETVYLVMDSVLPNEAYDLNVTIQ